MIGKIKVLKNGYGFIVPHDGGKDVFFHLKSLQKGLEFRNLHEGDILHFEVEDTPKGLNALNVSLQNESVISDL